MTSAQVVETSVKVTLNSPSQDYTHPDDHNLLTYDMTPGFKPFTIIILSMKADLMWHHFYGKSQNQLWPEITGVRRVLSPLHHPYPYTTGVHGNI